MNYYERTVSRSQRRVTVWLLSAVTAVILGAVGLALYVMAQPTGPVFTDEINGAEQLVRGQLPSEVDVHFSDAAETTVEALAGDRYRVSGWVDLVTHEGADERDAYVCVMHQGAEGDWIADEVNMVQK